MIATNGEREVSGNSPVRQAGAGQLPFSLAMATADRTAMRILRSLLFVLLAPLAGCLEMEQTVTIAADGSGTQQLKMGIRETTLNDLVRASSAAQLGAAPNPKALFDKDLAGAELKEAGMLLSAHTSKLEAGKRTLDLTATFPNFAALQKTPLCGSVAEWVLTAGPKEGTAKLTLYPQGKTAWQEARAKAESMNKEPDAVAAAFFRKKQEELTGLDLTLRFQLPGDVLLWTANMEKTGDREVTARITAEQIKTPQDLVRRLAPRFEVVFDAKGCKLPLQ